MNTAVVAAVGAGAWRPPAEHPGVGSLPNAGGPRTPSTLHAMGFRGPPRVRGPGLRWLPRVWQRAAFWRTVGRFVVLGPLVGGAPYALFLVTIPFAYLIGTGPALVAGLLFGTWYHVRPGAPPRWPWRAVIGALAGAGAAAATAAMASLWGSAADLTLPAIVALHGVPAGVLLALLQRPPSVR